MSLSEALLGSTPLLLDGAVGTELSLRGEKIDLPLWGSHCLINNPSLIYDIHCEYLEAGANLICSHSFRTQSYVLDKRGHGGQAERLTKRSVALCQKAISQHSGSAWILGSMAPLEDCYQPEDTPNHNILFREHRAHAKQLADAGVHGFILETFSHPRELRAALMACATFGLPRILSLHGSAHLTQIVKKIDTEYWAPNFWGINCHKPDKTTSLHKKLQQSTSKPTAAYAQIGYEDDNGNWYETGLVNEDEYAQEAMEWVNQGAKIIGGCCGTRPSYTKAMRFLLDKI